MNTGTCVLSIENDELFNDKSEYPVVDSLQGLCIKQLAMSGVTHFNCLPTVEDDSDYSILPLEILSEYFYKMDPKTLKRLERKMNLNCLSKLNHILQFVWYRKLLQHKLMMASYDFFDAPDRIKAGDTDFRREYWNQDLFEDYYTDHLSVVDLPISNIEIRDAININDIASEHKKDIQKGIEKIHIHNFNERDWKENVLGDALDWISVCPKLKELVMYNTTIDFQRIVKQLETRKKKFSELLKLKLYCNRFYFETALSSLGSAFSTLVSEIVIVERNYIKPNFADEEFPISAHMPVIPLNILKQRSSAVRSLKFASSCHRQDEVSFFVSHFSNLRSLELTRAHQITSVVPLITNAPRLTELYLKYRKKIKLNEILQFFEFTDREPLKVLWISHCVGFCYEDLFHILTSEILRSSLQRLHIDAVSGRWSNIKLENLSTAAIEFLKKAENLEQLELDSVLELDINAICKGLSSNTALSSVKYLSLRNCGMNNESCLSVLSLFISSSTISEMEYLDFSDNKELDLSGKVDIYKALIGARDEYDRANEALMLNSKKKRKVDSSRMLRLKVLDVTSQVVPGDPDSDVKQEAHPLLIKEDTGVHLCKLRTLMIVFTQRYLTVI